MPNNSNNYANSSTSTLWQHLKNYHPNIIGGNDEQQEQTDNQGVQKKEKVFIVFKFLCI